MKSAKTADTCNMWKRLFGLFASIMELVVADRRYAVEVADVLQVIKDKKDFAIRLGIRKISDADTKRQLLSWQELYVEAGIGLDISGLVIPPHKEGFDRLIVVAQGLTPEKIFLAMKKKMPAWKYQSNLNEVESVRKTDKTYAIWVRDRVEADEELKNKSANDLKSDGTNCITLEEHLLLEMMYFEETGKYLDIQNWTLCASSCRAVGSVPGVRWLDGKVRVSWFGSGFAHVGLRGRSVVS